MCENLKPILRHHNKQQIAVDKVLSGVPQCHSADISQLHASTFHGRRNDFVWHDVSTGGKVLVFQRAGEAPGCVLEALQRWSDPRHSTTGIMPGYITIQTSAGSPPPPHPLSQLYSFIINTSWRQSHSPSFTTHCKLLTVVPLTTQRHAGTLWFTLESSNTRCYNNVTPISILGGKKSTLRHFQIELNYLSPQVEEKSHTWLCNTWQPALNTLHPRGGVWGGVPSRWPLAGPAAGFLLHVNWPCW